MADPIRDFLTDGNSDLAVVNGDFAPVAGQAAVQQGIAVRCRTFLGEIFLDQSQGVDYFGQVFIKNPNPINVRDQIRAAISEVPDITNLVGTQLELDSQRNASISFVVNTIYSAQPFVGSIGVG